MTYTLIFIWFPFWTSQAGYSMKQFDNRLQKWQAFASWGGKVPELIIAATIASVSAWGWCSVFPALNPFAVWLVAFVVAYAGKESATKGYLEWTGSTEDTNGDGVVDNDDARDNTLAGFNQWVAGLFGWQNGDEGYSWVWAATKGFITTLPIGGIGVAFLPLFREAASHARGRVKGDENFYLEFFGDGFAYAASVSLFVFIINAILAM